MAPTPRGRGAPAAAALFLLLLLAGVSLACEPIMVEMCRGIGYNHTGLSALAQKEAEFVLQTFNPLVQYGCSAQLQLFLCAVFVPMCTDKVAAPIGPCRGLCLGVRRRCLPVLLGFGFPWPASLNCSLFPADNNHETMCMEGPGEERDQPPPPAPPPILPPATMPPPAMDACPQGRCQPACEADILWTAGEKRLAEAWTTGWAALGFAASLAAALTLISGGGGRGRPASRCYPAAVAFMALSQNLSAVGWAVRAAAGRRAVACSAQGLLLTKDGLANANCAVVFLMLYYFGTAASVWWVVTCLWWFLSAGGGWSQERVHQQSSLFHLAGWGLPAVCTVAALVLRHVDADELTGACLVGNQSSRPLLVLVLVPQLVWLLSGCGLLVAGCWARRRRRRRAIGRTATAGDVAPRAKQGDVCRLGALAATCALPAFLSLVSLLVEYGARLQLEETGAGRPPLWAALLRAAAGPAGAVATAAWVCSPPPCRSLRAWRRLGPCKQPPPSTLSVGGGGGGSAVGGGATVKLVTAHYYQPAPQQLPLRPQYHHKHLPHAGCALLPPAPQAGVHSVQKTRKHRSKHAKHGSETTV